MNEQLLMDFNIAILAGGRSSRMGRDKGLVRLGGQALVEHVVAAATGLDGEMFLATNRPDEYRYLGLRMVQDETPGAGSLEGLRTALTAASTEAVLVLACDLPFLRPPLLERLVRSTMQGHARVPRFDGRLQPLVALYARACLPAVERARSRGEMSLQTLLRTLDLRELDESEVVSLDPKGLSFFNVNSLQDLKEAERILHDLNAGGAKVSSAASPRSKAGPE